MANDVLRGIENSFLQHFSELFPEGTLGIEVYSNQLDSVILSHNADQLLRPASTLKILATAAALDTIAADTYFETKVRLEGKKYGKTFWGKVIIDPQANPGFTGRFFEHPAEALKPIAKNLKALGIDSIWGEIKVDHSFLTEEPWPKTWENKFKNRCFAALVQSSVFNENCARLVVEPGENPGDKPIAYTEPYLGFYKIENKAITQGGGKRNIQFSLSDSLDQVEIDGSIGLKAYPFSAAIPLRDPDAYFHRGIAYSFLMEGISFYEEKLTEEMPLYREFHVKTVTLEDVVSVINTRSHNLFAELILRHLGNAYYNKAGLLEGLKAVRQFLAKTGVKDTSQVLLDGSGLSYDNRIQPKAMNQVLRYMLHNKNRDVFINSLNYATESGAMGTRMLDLIYPYGVRFKTGFVAETQGLVGYIFTATGDTLSLSILVNNYKIDDYTARKNMDSLWKELTYAYDRERASLMEMESLYAVGDSLKKIEDRLDFFSQYFLDRPYFSPPTGEGIYGQLKQELLMNTSAFDCVTYIEHVMALVYSKDTSTIMETLQSIRYLKGEVQFEKRNHFFIEDWLKNNKARVQSFVEWADRDSTRISDKKKFAGFFKKEFPLENPKTRLQYISMPKADSLFSQIWQGEKKVYGVALVGDLDWLWVTHTGFLILEKGKIPTFRHASSKAGKISNTPFAEYLKTRTKIHGVSLFSFGALHD